ncbi:MAG: hypothetical protein ABFD79_07525 [Phycisphaerales bacterium]
MSICNLFVELHEDNCRYQPTSEISYLADQYEPHPETTIEYFCQEKALLAV